MSLNFVLKAPWAAIALFENEILFEACKKINCLKQLFYEAIKMLKQYPLTISGNMNNGT